MNNKIIFGGIAVAIVIGIAGIFLPKVSNLAGASPTGSTFGAAKFAGIVVNNVNSTSSSILNTDGNARYIESLKVACTGVGSSKAGFTGAATIANWNLTVGTTSTANPVTQVIPAIAVVLNGVLATSTPNLLLSSTTAPIAAGGAANGTASSSSAALWQSGEYLTFVTNATNTAVCTFGVGYIGS
jgi:hypothetical protein